MKLGLSHKNGLFTPPQISGSIISTPKIGGGVPPLSKNRPLRQAKFILARLLAPYALTRGLEQKTLWYTPPPALCKALGGLLQSTFWPKVPLVQSGENRGFSCIFVFPAKTVFFRVFSTFFVFFWKNQWKTQGFYKKFYRSSINNVM